MGGGAASTGIGSRGVLKHGVQRAGYGVRGRGAGGRGQSGDPFIWVQMFKRGVRLGGKRSRCIRE